MQELMSQISEIATPEAKFHFFMDEAPFGQTGLTTDFIQNLSEMLQPESFFWIACKKSNCPHPSLLESKYYDLTWPVFDFTWYTLPVG